MIQTLISFVTGPFVKLAEVYVNSRERTRAAEIERAVKKDFITGELKKEMIKDEGMRAEMGRAILRRDRGDWKTAWIRPVTASIALIFWIALCLSQMTWGGDGILPIIWHVPPGLLGQAFLAFPMGVLTTFYIARPFEKYFIGKSL